MNSRYLDMLNEYLECTPEGSFEHDRTLQEIRDETKRVTECGEPKELNFNDELS